MQYSIEVLHHFTCDKCKMWWSIAAIAEMLVNKKGWWCPWCGHQHIPPYENITIGQQHQHHLENISIDDPSIPKEIRDKLIKK